MPPPFKSSASSSSEAQYAIHAATSSVSASRSLRLSWPQRRIVAYHGSPSAIRARGRAFRLVNPTSEAVEPATNCRREMDMDVFKVRRGADRSSTLESAARAECQEVIRSEEHTSELQSPMYLVCRLLLEKKK